ncbi:MAG: hypothetical protein WDN24_08165 [Sphingomonas sp.]
MLWFSRMQSTGAPAVRPASARARLRSARLGLPSCSAALAVQPASASASAGRPRCVRSCRPSLGVGDERAQRAGPGDESVGARPRLDDVAAAILAARAAEDEDYPWALAFSAIPCTAASWWIVRRGNTIG